jgi:hypothetical protein
MFSKGKSGSLCGAGSIVAPLESLLVVAQAKLALTRHPSLAILPIRLWVNNCDDIPISHGTATNTETVCLLEGEPLGILKPNYEAPGV